MIGRSNNLEDVGRVTSSFPTYLGKIEATLLAGLRKAKNFEMTDPFVYNFRGLSHD